MFYGGPAQCQVTPSTRRCSHYCNRTHRSVSTQVWKEKEMRRQLLLDPKPPKRKKQPLRLKKGQVQHVIKKDEWEPPPRAHCPPTRPQSASAMRRENKHQKLVWKMHRRDKRMIAASRGAAAPSRRRRASSPGMMDVGGLFFDFGAASESPRVFRRRSTKMLSGLVSWTSGTSCGAVGCLIWRFY